MGLEMVLNDLSLFPPAEDIYMARERMLKLVDIVVAAASLKIERVLRTDSNINMVELTGGYPIARWLNDPEVDRETRRYFRSLATKAPYLQDISDSKVLDTYYSSDFSHRQHKAVGLGLAFLLDALAISFHSHSDWKMSSLELSLEQLQEDGVISREVISVKNACLREHIREHSDWIKRRTQVDIQCGADLWTYRESLYPHLQFCASVGLQMQALLHGDIHLNRIMKHLQHLNDYCESWQSGLFSQKAIALDISLESQATLQRYSQERTFLCPDNVPRRFNWHSKDKFINWRIYFHPVEQEKSMIIGYIGAHLSIVTSPT